VSTRVLLADDHAVLLDGLQLLLATQPDLEVVGTAANGRQALHLVEQLDPDVVVMDIAMPELNGIEATRQIRALCPRTQVIMLSIHHTPEHIARALRAGARGYVLKESAGDEVVEAIQRVHGGRRYLSPGAEDTLLDYYLLHHEPQEESDPWALLSGREREVLQLVVEGRSPTEIADILSLSLSTVKSYRSRILQKLGVRNLPDLVKLAIQHGLISLD